MRHLEPRHVEASDAPLGVGDTRASVRALHGLRAEVIGADAGLRAVVTLVRQVAPLACPVLLVGETGTGKELFAHAVHRLSPRRDGPFVRVNCGAIPETLIDSELFGHERGAFTDSVSQHRGRFERADGGTIFLDEIGELPPRAQTRLLRVLQEHEIERVGGSEPVRLDFRVVAASNADLRELTAAGRFRPDLYYRLSTFPVALPPLRDRRQDIPALVRHFIAVKSRDMHRAAPVTLERGALDALVAYAWPGNVRELENAIERALIIHPDGPLSFPDLGTVAAHGAAGAPVFAEQAAAPEDDPALDRVVARHMLAVLERVGGRIEGPGGAAELLRVKPSTLRKRMRKLGVSFGRGYRAAASQP